MLATYDPLQVIVQMVSRVATAPERAEARVAIILDTLGQALQASVGLLLRADRAHVDVIFVGRPASGEPAASLRHRLRLERSADPLLDPCATGDLRPRTGQRAYGGAGWSAAATRAQCRALWGADQVVVLPIAGGDQFVVALMGRVGEDFSDAEVALLASVQPVVTALGLLMRLPHLPAPTGGGTAYLPLTQRELEVIDPLAHGHKASTIARIAGCSARTVHRHLGNIYGKLGVSDRLSAVNRAHQLGLLEAEDSLVC